MTSEPLTSIELFTGAGGLALGTAQAGFSHEAVIEWNRDACASLRENAGRISIMRNWSVFEGDVRTYDFTPHARRISLVAAGAPCQPWSLGGKHGGYDDDRNLFPDVFRAVRQTLPSAVIVENVKGLLRTGFHDYFEYIQLCLTAPEMPPRKGEDWVSHGHRLEQAVLSDRVEGTRYRVAWQLLNACDYGVPQRRERVFIVALRSDLGVEWPGMEPSHSEDALLFAKWVDGSYWREHGIRPKPMPERFASRIERLRKSAGDLFELSRWRTVRDAIGDLPAPVDYREHPIFANHVGNPGARAYPGHTGSPYDEPAKTLKAGDHGVPGGENMLRDDYGNVRYFTVREAARLQTFPDAYQFRGAWCEGFRQLGNAVPVALAQSVALRVRSLMEPRVVMAKARVVEETTPLATSVA